MPEPPFLRYRQAKTYPACKYQYHYADLDPDYFRRQVRSPATAALSQHSFSYRHISSFDYHFIMRLLVLTLLFIALDAYNIPPTGVKRTSEVGCGLNVDVFGRLIPWLPNVSKLFARIGWRSVIGTATLSKDPYLILNLDVYPLVQSFLRRCKDCLSWRGANCMDCFEM